MLLADTLSRAYSEDYERISHRIRGGVHPCHSLPSCSRLPAQGTSERNGLWSNSTVFKESNLGWLPRYKGKTTSSHSPVLWNPRWALSTWWCNIQGPAMHHNANPETKDWAEATRLPYWVQGCLCRAQETVYWPGMNAKITDYIQKCDVCMSLQKNQTKEPLICHEPTSRPWEKVATDIIPTWWQELSVHSSYYSGYFEVDQLHGKTGTVIIKKLKKHFVTHGTPNELLSGNEPPFNSAEFENFLRSSGSAHVTSSPGQQRVSHSQQCQLRGTSLNSQPKPLLQYLARPNLCAQHLTKPGQLKIGSQELVGCQSHLAI